MVLGAMKGGDMGEGAVVVTSYGLVSAKPELFAPRGNELKWDYVILDEGHKIKNRSTRYDGLFSCFVLILLFFITSLILQCVPYTTLYKTYRGKATSISCGSGLFGRTFIPISLSKHRYQFP